MFDKIIGASSGGICVVTGIIALREGETILAFIGISAGVAFLTMAFTK